MANPAAALGQAVGNLIEESIREGLRSMVEERGYTIEAKSLENGSGNSYQIDCVIADTEDRPVIIVDPKYIRYTKHNRDKGSWLCTAHYNLRKTFPSIRKSIAILTGRWSAPSIALIRSFGVEVHRVAFATIADALQRRGVEFDWEEGDSDTPAASWERFQDLTNEQLASIADDIVQTTGLIAELRQSVTNTLDTDLTAIQRRVASIEVLLKTTHDEFILRSYGSVHEAMQALLNLLEDRPIDESV
ncbi:MAG: hypothetical protein Q8P22_05065 [Chloroflexota bacterium]|nr:hypothetical protein [Chloroflexota bacterium]